MNLSPPCRQRPMQCLGLSFVSLLFAFKLSGCSSLLMGVSLFGTFAVMGLGDRVLAQPADVFRPSLPDMIRNAPPGFPIRLPGVIKPIGNQWPEEGQLQVKVFASELPTTLTVGLFRCDGGALPCFVGSITTDRSSAVHARAELERHQRGGDRLTFRPGLVGYLMDGAKRRASERFTSVMWQQENVIYTVNFPAGDRQAVIDMAGSMAISEPIRVSLPPSIPASTLPGAEGNKVR